MPADGSEQINILPTVALTATRNHRTFWSAIGHVMWDAVDYTPFGGSMKQIGMGIYQRNWKEAAIGVLMLGVDVLTVGEGGEIIRLAKKGSQILAKDEVKEIAEKEIAEQLEKKAGAEVAEDAVHGNSVKSTKPTEKYTIVDENGKEYHGIWQPGKRAELSLKRLQENHPDKTFTIKDRMTYPNRKEALKAESRGIGNQILREQVYNKIDMSLSHERYKWVPGSNKYFFYLNSDSIEEDISWILANNIENIKLNQLDGYKFKTIEPILVLRHIKTLDIFIEGVDLSNLRVFKKLEDLGIGEKSVNIDLSGLVNLKSLYLFCPKHIKGLNTLINLEKLVIVKGSIDFFKAELFTAWPNLNELALLSPKLPDSLSFLKNQRNLK